MKRQMINQLTILSLAMAGLFAIGAAANVDPPVHTKLFIRQIDATTPPFAGPTIEGSSAKLQRSADAIWIKINTTQLPAGAYSVWVVVFNNPSACAGGVGACGASDIPNADVRASVLWGTGGPVDETGVGHANIFIEEGMPPGLVLGAGCACGLEDAEDAEVHFIVRYHGPVSDDPSIAELQFTTPGGGCFANFPFFACYEPQAGRFPFFGN